MHPDKSARKPGETRLMEHRASLPQSIHATLEEANYKTERQLEIQICHFLTGARAGEVFFVVFVNADASTLPMYIISRIKY